MDLTLPLFIAAGMFGYVIYVFIGGVFGEEAHEDRKIQKRLKTLILQRKESLLRRSKVSSIRVLNDVLGNSRFMAQIEELLRVSKLSITPVTFLLIDAALFFVLVMAIGMLSGNMDLAFFLALIFSSIPFGILILNKQAYLTKFVLAFPDALAMMRNAVRSGQGLQSAIKLVADEGPYPVSVEFDRIVKEIDMGGHTDEALNSLVKRVQANDVRLFVIGILIQTELGGNIGDLFENIGKTIRERITANRELKALTAQGKSSSIILMLLPFVIFGAIQLINPEYFRPLLTTDVGHKVIIFMFVWLGIGAGVITKMTQGIKMT